MATKDRDAVGKFHARISLCFFYAKQAEDLQAKWRKVPTGWDTERWQEEAVFTIAIFLALVQSLEKLYPATDGENFHLDNRKQLSRKAEVATVLYLDGIERQEPRSVLQAVELLQQCHRC